MKMQRGTSHLFTHPELVLGIKIKNHAKTSAV